MNITKIELYNFRNYEKYKIDKFSNLNIIIGRNGIGKTSILEAIYLGSLAKSFKSKEDCAMIKDGESALKIIISYYHDIVKRKIEIIVNKSGKKTKINDFVQRRLSDFISQYKVILLSPDELKIIKSSPNTRRNYINIQISQLYKDYITILNNYNSLIKNKNDFLKKLMLNGNMDTNYLDIVDSKIIDLGMKIYDYRKDYFEKINKYIVNIFGVFNKKDDIRIKYISDFDLNDKKKIESLIRKNRNREINLGMATIGIHRDDFEFIINDLDAKDYCSQGTQKLIVLSLKLSEIEIFKNDYNIKPVILLDDLFSELDSVNRNKVFSAIKKDMQVFITTTDLKNISKRIIDKARVFNLDERK